MRIIIMLFLVLSIPVFASAQDCFPNGITFSSQANLFWFRDNYPNCTTIEGDVVIEGGFVSLQSALENVVEIQGNLDIVNCWSFSNTISFENLKTIGGHLVIHNNQSLGDLDGFNALESIGGHIRIENNHSLVDIDGLESLNSIGHSLVVRDNPILTTLQGFSNLNSVNGGLFIENNDNLTNLEGLNSLNGLPYDTGLDYHNYKQVSIKDNHRLENLSGLDFLEYYDECIIIKNNPNLSSLWGLHNLTHVEDLILINNDLEDLSDLESLENIFTLELSSSDKIKNFEGMLSINEIKYLSLSDNAALDDSFKGLEPITTLIKGLTINNCPQVTHLNGLEHITVIGRRFNISNNPSLVSLESLKGATFQYLQYLFVKNNPSLSECDILGICDFIELSPEIVFIENNQENCNSIIDFATACDLETIKVSSFFDHNQNGLKDEDDYKLNQSYETDIVSSFTINESSSYSYLVLPGDYTITWQNDANWTPTTPASFAVTIVEGEQIEFEIGLYPSNEVNEVSTDITASRTLCNDIANFWISYENTGTTTIDGSIRLKIDTLTSFVSATPAPDLIDGNNVYWSYENLLPTFGGQINVVLQMPNEQFIGEELFFGVLNQIIDENEIVLFEGQAGDLSELLCSYDPNDKLINPDREGDENYTLHDETLTYTVRFQNTGNYLAQRVVIRDYLDSNLDWSSLRTISSSHAVKTEFLETGLVKFIFDEINLPDSTSNPLGSQGYVKFEIRALQDLPEFTEITNEANIYFDYNPPIITNTTTSTLVDNLCFTIDDSEAIVYSSASVLINWERPFSGEVYRLRYREIGEAWNYINDIIATEKFIYELEANTTYQYQLRSTCEELGISTWTPSKTFTTLDGVCDFPLPIIREICKNAVHLDWRPIEGANKYRIKYKKAGAPWLEVETATVNGFLNNLTPNTSYQYKIKTVCDNEGSVWSPSFYFTTTNAICNYPSNPSISSSIVERSILSESDINIFDHHFKMYPNPSKNNLTIQWSGNEPATIKMYNTIGQQVKTIQELTSGNAVDVSNLENSTYFMQIEIGEETIQKRFVKME